MDQLGPIEKCPSGLKRRRSSIENDVMQKRLQEWRKKKGKPILGSFHEEQENQRKQTSVSSKHATPSHFMKRKTPALLSQSERKHDRTTSQNKQSRFLTPGPSSRGQENTACSSSSSRPNTSQLCKQSGRRSLGAGTSKDVTRQPRYCKPTDCCERLNLEDRMSEPVESATKVSAQEVVDKSNARSHTAFLWGRKSVRFLSPQGQGEKAASTGTVSSETPIPCTPVTTPASNRSKLGIRERLEQWLISKGKTPSRFHNFLGYESSLVHHARPGCNKRRKSGTPLPGRRRGSTPGGGLTPMGRGVDPVQETMRECLVMLEEGCPVADMSALLDGMVTKVPLIQQSAAYWLCRAKVAEKQVGDQSAMECLFEAVEFSAEPMKDILDSLAAYRLKLTLTDEEFENTELTTTNQDWKPVETGVQTPLRRSPHLQVQTPVAQLHFEEEDMNHSPEADDSDRSTGDVSHLSIKYSFRETTPYFARIHGTSSNSSHTPCLMITPVRRSARLDNKRRSVVSLGNQSVCTPAATDECLDSVTDIAAAYPSAQLILRPNRALAAEFSEEDFIN